jgi:regulator of sirC expression with transglutaminase-like and TPR domain
MAADFDYRDCPPPSLTPGRFNGLNTGQAERRQIVRFAGRDDVAVGHHFGIFPECARVHHVILDREEGGGAFALQHAGRAENPRSVTNGRDELALRPQLPNEIDGERVAANEVRREASGGDHPIEILGPRDVVRDVGLARVAEFALVSFARDCPYGDDFRARFAQPIERIPNFHFLVQLIDQDCDAFAVQTHSFSLVPGCYSYVRVHPAESQALLDLLARRPADIELDRAALELARIEYPELDIGHYIRELDRHALAIADRAADLSDGRGYVETANLYLFGELGLAGNQTDYYNSENSMLNRVLETKLGVPITLSAIYLEISRRLAKPMVGIGLPGHFIVYYDDGEYSTYIDPFHGGALIDIAGCCELAQVDALEPGMLEPVDLRTIVMRMVNNLRNVYFSRREPVKAERVIDLLIAANPMSPEEHKQRGVVLLQQERMGESMAAFNRYLELWPGAPDRERVQEQIRNLGAWLATRN